MSSKPVRVLSILLAVALCTLLSAAAAARPYLTAYFIDVGQGDAILLRDGAGFDALVDGGPPDAGPALVDFLHQEGITQLDALVATHADGDHTGGLAAVLADPSIQIEHVLTNGLSADTETWQAFDAGVHARGLTLETLAYPQLIRWGAFQVQVLNPDPLNPIDSDGGDSLILRVTYGRVSYLLTGDLDETAESAIIARGLSLDADVLKVPHHGSKYGSSLPFLAMVGAREAIISVGENDYGHPEEQTLARLRASGARVWRTDRDGTLLVSSDGWLLHVSNVGWVER